MVKALPDINGHQDVSAIVSYRQLGVMLFDSIKHAQCCPLLRREDHSRPHVSLDGCLFQLHDCAAMYIRVLHERKLVHECLHL